MNSQPDVAHPQRPADDASGDTRTMNAAGPDPKSEWERFRPTAYGLDPERVYKLPVIRVSLNPAGHEDETPTTLGEVLASLVC